MIQNYDRLVEVAAYVEITVEAEEERIRGSRSRGQGSQGDYRPNKKTFAFALGLEVARLTSLLKVESPVGGIVDLDRGCRGCEIVVAGHRLSFAFVLLDMSCFDATLDRVNRVLLPIYDPRSRNELSGLFATLLDSKSDGTRVKLPRVVCEYPNIFPKDLTSLPPHQEIKFTIDLMPGTTPISMAPYRKRRGEPAELGRGSMN
ncbi:uncharacterized protein LOC114272228 [Camellia sinensis]|uniref:uncharacterized protein LOC114272228 n=1 Tax=Camellia sinensis TaxID=4442 RepID=UPI001036B2B1|nr:uncharacterized protein LOC114272228 [Camellia sinensis]